MVKFSSNLHDVWSSNDIFKVNPNLILISVSLWTRGLIYGKDNEHDFAAVLILKFWSAILKHINFMYSTGH